MKVLLICGLVLAGAFLAEAEGGRELCGMTHEGIKGVLKCMAAQAPPQEKVAEAIKEAYRRCKPPIAL
ncbi:hypothetical protein MRX96_012418 [Rhipicephalus microplus]